jgi:hypothetical protein
MIASLWLSSLRRFPPVGPTIPTERMIVVATKPARRDLHRSERKRQTNADAKTVECTTVQKVPSLVVESTSIVLKSEAKSQSTVVWTRSIRTRRELPYLRRTRAGWGNGMSITSLPFLGLCSVAYLRLEANSHKVLMASDWVPRTDLSQCSRVGSCQNTPQGVQVLPRFP